MTSTRGVAIRWRPDHECGPVNQFIGANIDERLSDALRTQALANGVSVAGLVRRLLRQALAAEGVDPYA